MKSYKHTDLQSGVGGLRGTYRKGHLVLINTHKHFLFSVTHSTMDHCLYSTERKEDTVAACWVGVMSEKQKKDLVQ